MPDSTLQILTAPELLKLKADTGRTGVRKARHAFNRGGAFDLITLAASDKSPSEVVAVVGVPVKNLTPEQLGEIAKAHEAEAAKLTQPETK